MKINKKLTMLTIAGVTTLGLAVATPTIVSAQIADGDASEFVQQLAEKLGISEDAVQSAVDEIKDERQAERQAERQEAIDAAVESGELSQEQADLIAALQEVRENIEKPENELTREEMQALTEEEREALREEMKAERQQVTIDALAEAGYTVTADQLEELREATEELGIGGGHKGGRRGPGGPRGGVEASAEATDA